MISSKSYSDFYTQQSQYNNTPQLLAYYPKYVYLDNMLSTNSKSCINIFIDLKGCAVGIYQEWCVKHIIESSRIDNHLNLDMFTSILSFIAFHKKYAAKRNIKIKFYFFMEQGKSKYHLNIYDKYKQNRQNSDFFGLDLESREKFFSVLDKNYSLCEYVINKIPDCQFYCLKYCEADFVPYYLMKYKLSQDDLNNSLNIVYSRDKDMLQCLEFPNSYQFYKALSGNRTDFITEEKIYKHFFKDDKLEPLENGAKWFPFVLSLIGDVSDGIPGINGIGKAAIWKNFDVIKKAYNNDPDVMYSRIMKGDNIITESWEYSSTATLQKIFGYPDILKRNMGLISYRALSDYLIGGFPTEAIDVRNYIDKIWNNDVKLSSYSILWKSMIDKKLGDIIDERTVEECFL